MTITKKIFSYSCITALLVTGCGLFSGDEVGVRIRTDRELYDATSSIVTLTITNLSDNPIYYLCTGSITLQELDEGRLKKEWSVHGFELCGKRTPITQGKSAQFVFDLESDFLSDRLKEAQFDDGVRYRFEIDMYEDSDLKRPLPQEDRFSNQFTIVRS